MSPRFALLVAAAFALAPRSADACSLQVGFAETAPRDGARLPQNGVWFVTGYQVDPVSGTWLDFDVFLPLRAEKRINVYEMHNDFSEYYGREADVSAESGRDNVEPIRRQFRVVAFVDEDAPEVTPPTNLTAFYQRADSAGCIDEGWLVTFRVDRVFDDFGLGAFYVMKETSSGPVLVQARIADPGAVAERLSFTVNAGVQGGDTCYFVRAVDLAGHTTDSDLACIALGEDPPLVDAGFVDSGATSSARRTAPEGLDLSGRGCACEAHHDGRASPFVFALIVLWACARRRPHPR